MHACACKRSLLTGWQAAQYARACTARCNPRCRWTRRDIWEELANLCGCTCIRRPYAYVGEGCACSVSVRQRAPTVSVATVVENGLPMSIETWPEPRGMSAQPGGLVWLLGRNRVCLRNSWADGLYRANPLLPAGSGRRKMHRCLVPLSSRGCNEPANR